MNQRLAFIAPALSLACSEPEESHRPRGSEIFNIRFDLIENEGGFIAALETLQVAEDRGLLSDSKPYYEQIFDRLCELDKKLDLDPKLIARIAARVFMDSPSLGIQVGNVVSLNNSEIIRRRHELFEWSMKHDVARFVCRRILNAVTADEEHEQFAFNSDEEILFMMQLAIVSGDTKQYQKWAIVKAHTELDAFITWHLHGNSSQPIPACTETKHFDLGMLTLVELKGAGGDVCKNLDRIVNICRGRLAEISTDDWPSFSESARQAALKRLQSFTMKCKK